LEKTLDGSFVTIDKKSSISEKANKFQTQSQQTSYFEAQTAKKSWFHSSLVMRGAFEFLQKVIPRHRSKQNVGVYLLGVINARSRTSQLCI
jgi:hypothetical protein